MEPIDVNLIKQQFDGRKAEISITDRMGSDQAPSVRKFIKKVQLCPDSTHIRFYFDDFYFLAVPLTAKTNQTETGWTALDTESGLTYTVNF
ncbi:MAG: hypothetical protein Q8906_04165 [Bacillota bacterium]|nr:hypothetical protein [Bacillota bacterium]MDP4169782.1 hypothetical protein [Bacillota bacterium]